MSSSSIFKGVSVGFPIGTNVGPAAGWTPWSVGELRVDSSSFGLTFAPAGGGVAAKPLGCLTGLAGPQDAFGAPALVAATSDPVHNLLRLGFQTHLDVEAFAALARASESVGGRRHHGCAGRRSSISRRSSLCGGPERGLQRDEEFAEALAASISERYAGAYPLVYSGAELFGEDPTATSPGTEVLLGRGAVVLLDPPQNSAVVGAYELLFYDESSLAAPVRSIPVGPRLSLAALPQPDSAGCSPHAPHAGRRLSSARRRSSLPGGGDVALRSSSPTFEFSLAMPGCSWVLAFDRRVDAQGFARDLAVRQRVMQLSAKTSRRAGVIGELEDQLTELRRWIVLPFLCSSLLKGAVLACLAALLYGLALYQADPDADPLALVERALQDALSLAAGALARAADVSATVCSLALRAVPAIEVERCAAEMDAAEAQACVAALVRS